MSFYYRKICTFANLMRRFSEIAMAIMLLVCGSACNSWSGFRADDEVVARVGSTYLYNSELSFAMPMGISATDSVNYASAYISKWIVLHLKLEEAERLFSQSEEDIDRLVEEYRRSLLVRKLDQYLLKNAVSSEISERDIANYYNAHKSDFRIISPMVKGEILIFPDNYRRREQLLKLFNSPKDEHQEDFEQLCLKNNFQYQNFTDWVSASDFLSNLPLTRNSQHDKILANRNLQQIHHNKVYYYFRIKATLAKGDMMPLNMAKENIRQILINRHRSDIVREHEELLLKNALSSGHATRVDGR